MDKRLLVLSPTEPETARQTRLPLFFLWQNQHKKNSRACIDLWVNQKRTTHLPLFFLGLNHKTDIKSAYIKTGPGQEYLTPLFILCICKEVISETVNTIFTLCAHCNCNTASFHSARHCFAARLYYNTLVRSPVHYVHTKNMKFNTTFFFGKKIHKRVTAVEDAELKRTGKMYAAVEINKLWNRTYNHFDINVLFSYY